MGATAIGDRSRRARRDRAASSRTANRVHTPERAHGVDFSVAEGHRTAYPHFTNVCRASRPRCSRGIRCPERVPAPHRLDARARPPRPTAQRSRASEKFSRPLRPAAAIAAEEAAGGPFRSARPPAHGKRALRERRDHHAGSRASAAAADRAAPASTPTPTPSPVARRRQARTRDTTSVPGKTAPGTDVALRVQNAEVYAAKKGAFTGTPPGPKQLTGSCTVPPDLAQGAYRPQYPGPLP